MKSSSIGKFGGVANEEPVFYTIMADEIAAAVIESLRARITRVFPAQIRQCIEALGDEQIWWRPNEGENSIGNLVLHISGSLNLYLNKNIGGIAYERDRAAEFAERKHIPKTELLQVFDDMVARAERTFDALTPERLAEPSPEPTMHKTVVQDLLNVLTHIANHAGQIVWITKMLSEGSLDEVWMRTHKRLGGWVGPP
jgi:uncharacterized damage-inducible protein DinB